MNTTGAVDVVSEQFEPIAKIAAQPLPGVVHAPDVGGTHEATALAVGVVDVMWNNFEKNPGDGLGVVTVTVLLAKLTLTSVDGIGTLLFAA